MSFTLIRRAMKDFKLMPSVHALNILRKPCNLYAWLSLSLFSLQLRRLGWCSFNNTGDKQHGDFQALVGNGSRWAAALATWPSCLWSPLLRHPQHCAHTTWLAVWTLSQSKWSSPASWEVGRGWVTNYPFASQETEAREDWVAYQSWMLFVTSVLWDGWRSSWYCLSELKYADFDHAVAS